uniref:small monomeric GTPase n=1 Tax=Denticeps clupeoides TaxID=299321 RepID=A0AAY4CXT5_9TELE
MDGSQQRFEANILLLGAENVGKSALTVRFLTRRFIGEYGDIESIYSHNDKIDGREISFNIWDSLYPQNCGTPESVSDKQLQWADGVILVYSICDRSSFKVVQQQVQLIRRSRKMNPLMSGLTSLSHVKKADTILKSEDLESAGLIQPLSYARFLYNKVISL